MIFANAGALFLLVLLPPLALLMLINFRRKKKLLSLFLSPDAQRSLAVRSRRDFDFFRSLLLLLAVSFLILALARPQWGERLESTDVRGLQIAFLLDTSNSMAAEDLRPNRLEAAKALIGTCVDNLRTDLVALVNFAASGYVQCPLTTDYEAFKLLTEASAISPAEEQGTDFAAAFKLLLETQKPLPGSQRLAVLITDGEDQEKRWPELLSEVKKSGIILFAVGVGAAGGAPIPLRDREGRTVDWKKDKAGELVRTALDEPTLIRIAAETGGQYFRLTETAGIRDFLSLLQHHERRTLSQKMKSRRIERFGIPLAAAILLLFLEMLFTDMRISWARSSPS